MSIYLTRKALNGVWSALDAPRFGVLCMLTEFESIELGRAISIGHGLTSWLLCLCNVTVDVADASPCS